jgi:N-acetyl-gamma-glutamyl-phosphate reductase
MSDASKARIAVLGASGYTGAELVRLLLRHPRAEIVLLTADRRAGQEMAAVFPQFSPFRLPKLVSIDGIDWSKAALDLVFCALPHGTTQKVIKEVLGKAGGLKVVDLSADFRLADPDAYARWYGHAHERSCSARPSMGFARFIGRPSSARGWSPIRAATRPAPSLRSFRCCGPRRSIRMRS